MSSGLGRGVHGVSSFRNQSPSRVHAPPIMIDLPASVSLKKTCIIVSRVGSRTPGGPFRHVTTLSLVGTDLPGTDRDSGKTICWSRSSFFFALRSHSQLFTLLASAGECRLSTWKSSARALSMAVRAGSTPARARARVSRGGRGQCDGRRR
jgi:hypothetical protein